MAHLHEHLSVMRSEMFPIRRELNRVLHHRYAASLGAGTDKYCMVHEVNTTVEGWSEAWGGITGAVFFPLFDREDVEQEKLIVRAEREERCGPWWPYRSEVDHLFQILHFTPLYDRTSEEQKDLVFGSDETLKSVSVEDLRRLSVHFRTGKTRIIVAGPACIRDRIRIPSISASTPLEIAMPTMRSRREGILDRYIHAPRTSTPAFQAYMEAPMPAWEVEEALDFLCQFLCTSEGPLYQWAREENGWAYSVHCSFGVDRDGMFIDVHIPTRGKEYADSIYRHWREIVRHRLTQVNWEEELTVRQQANRYGFRHSGKCVSSALNDLYLYDVIHTETEWHHLMDRMKSNPPFLALFDEYFSEQVMAQGILLPKME